MSAGMFVLSVTMAVGIATALPARGLPPLAQVPLFTRLAQDQVRGYVAPVTLNVALHRFIFTFHFHLTGTVTYSAPDKVTFKIQRVPQQYQHLFNDLGTPLTWPQLYRLSVTGRVEVDGKPGLSLEGAPKKKTEVEIMELQTSDAVSPIHAQWTLNDGWSVKSVITEKATGVYLFPATEIADIAGHGYKIHTEMTYGAYALSPR